MPIPPERSAAVRQYIVSNEGWRTSAYHDSEGIPTVGVGFNLTRPDAGTRLQALGLNVGQVTRGEQSLSNEQVDMLFQADFNATVQAVEAIFPGFAGFSPGRQAVLVDLCFNLGPGRAPQPGRAGTGLRGFAAMIAAVNAGDWAAAEGHLLNSRYAGQVGTRAARNGAALRSGAMPALGGGGAKPLDKGAEKGSESSGSSGGGSGGGGGGGGGGGDKRGGEKGGDKGGGEKGQDKGGEKGGDKGAEKGGDKGAEKGGDKSGKEGPDKGLDRAAHWQ